MRREHLISLASSQEGAFYFIINMDLRKLVSACALLFLVMGISLVLWVSFRPTAPASHDIQLLSCCSTADNLSDEDYTRAIQKGLAKQQKGGNL